MIEVAGRASVGKLRMTLKIKDVITAVGIHIVSCDTAVYVGGHPVDMLVYTGLAVTLVHCRVLEKAKIDFKL